MFYILIVADGLDPEDLDVLELLLESIHDHGPPFDGGVGAVVETDLTKMRN